MNCWLLPVMPALIRPRGLPADPGSVPSHGRDLPFLLPDVVSLLWIFKCKLKYSVMLL